MANPIKSDDINFQPPVKSYAYSSSNPVPNTPANQGTQNSNNNSGEKKSNIFITLVFSILGFLFLFFIFLVVLNYFNVITLNNLSQNFWDGFRMLTKHKEITEQKLKSLGILLKTIALFFNPLSLTSQIKFGI